MREILVEFNEDEVPVEEQAKFLTLGLDSVHVVGRARGLAENFPTYRVAGNEDELMLFVVRWAMHDTRGGYLPEIIAGNGGEELAAALAQVLGQA